MNCYKFATIKTGSITASFSFNFDLGDGDSLSMSVSGSSSLNLGLTYKDICKLTKTGSLDKNWAIRGPGCEHYTRYQGKIIIPEKKVGGMGDLGSTYISGIEYKLQLYAVMDVFGCPFNLFTGRLNAYGRKARKAEENAPPPQGGATPCPSDTILMLVGVNPSDPDNEQDRVGVASFSYDYPLNYGVEDGAPYTKVGRVMTFSGINFIGEQYTRQLTYEVIGVRNYTITENYGDA